MHSDSNGSLCSSTDIIPVPCNTHGNIRIDAANETQQSRMDRGIKGHTHPLTAKKVPIYCTAGVSVEINSTNPIMATTQKNIM